MPQRDAIETSFRTKPNSSHQAGSNDGGGKPSDTPGSSIYKCFVLDKDSLGVWHPHTWTFQTYYIISCPQQQANRAWAVQALENEIPSHFDCKCTRNCLEIECHWPRAPLGKTSIVTLAVQIECSVETGCHPNKKSEMSKRRTIVKLTMHHAVNKPFRGH